MLCGVVGAPLVALDVPVPFVFPLSSLLFPLCAMVPTLLVGSVVVVPLSLPAVADCGGVVCILCLGALVSWFGECSSGPRGARGSPPPLPLELERVSYLQNKLASAKYYTVWQPGQSLSYQLMPGS